MLKIKSVFFVIFLLFGSLTHAQKVTTNYINKYLPLSQELSSQYQIPVSVVLGVAILESGSGTSRNCRQLNNHFGVTGKNHLKKRKSAYKQYANAEESYRDFCNMVSRKKFYPKLKQNKNYKSWLTAMNHASYAGAKNVWITRITNIIVKNRLNQYDQ